MVTTSGKCCLMFKIALCRAPETNKIVYVIYTSIINNKKACIIMLSVIRSLVPIPFSKMKMIFFIILKVIHFTFLLFAFIIFVYLDLFLNVVGGRGLNLFLLDGWLIKSTFFF